MSSTRQAAVFRHSDLRKSGIDANSCALNPTDRSRRPTELRRSASSSMIKTVECASEFAFDEPVSAMGFSPFTKLRFRACAQGFSLLTIDAYEQLLWLRAAHRR